MTYEQLTEQIEQHAANRNITVSTADISSDDLLSEVRKLRELLSAQAPQEQIIIPEAPYQNNDEAWTSLLMDIHKQEIITGKKVWSKEFDPVGRNIEIIPLGDLHVGHKAFNLSKLQAVIDYILSTPDAYTILVGDQAETATKQSIGKGLYEEDHHLKQQIEILEKLLRPLASTGKLLGIHPGNHEFRMEGLTGIDPMEWLARWLEVPYLGYQAYFYWTVRGIPYTCWSSHGKGGAQTFGGKVNGAQKQRDVHNCDLSLSGHIHEPTSSHRSFFEIDPSTMQVVKKTQWFVTVGGFLDYFGAYPEMKALSPTATRPIRISLFADEKFIKID